MGRKMKISTNTSLLKASFKIFLGPQLLLLVLLHSAYAAVPQQAYDAVIQSSKGTLSAEQLAPAINQLQRWHQENPENLRIICDLAVLLDKAGDYPSAELYYQQIIDTHEPAFAIRAVAHAALQQQHFQAAAAAYQLLILNAPDDIDAQVGLVYAWVGQQQITQAFNYVRQHLPTGEEYYSARHLPMLIALAELYEIRKDWLQAADTFRTVLQFSPEFRYARRQLVFDLKQAGAPYLAEQYAVQYAIEFSEQEKYQLAHDDAAVIINFGEAQLAADEQRSRSNTINVALIDNTELDQHFGAADQTRFDRLVALKDRGDMRAAVQLFATLTQEHSALPAYVQLAAADAYLSLQQPEAARDLYLQGLKQLSDSAPASLLAFQTSLMYAYSEAGQYREAEILSQQIVANQPPVIYQGMPGYTNVNPDFLHASVLKALLQMDQQRFDQAEVSLTALHAQVPFSNEIRFAWARLQVDREHPRAALDDYSSLLVDYPTLAQAAIGQGEVLLSLNEFAQAKALLPALLENYPEENAVQNFAEKLTSYDQPFYKIESMFGRGPTHIGADSLTDAIIYSTPFTEASNDRMRLLSHLVYAEGETTNNGKASRSRLGVGLDYRERDIDLQAEVNHTLDHPNLNGMALDLSWSLSDAWHAQAQLDSNVIDLPAQALAENLTAKAATLKLTWTLNESRNAGAEISSVRFSDGNLRTLTDLWWMQRWVSGPVFKLQTQLDLSASENSELNRAYFNPVRDTDLNLDIKAEWLTWQRYERSFKQRLDVSVGQYNQTGFNSGISAGLRYEHEWTPDHETLLSYGIGREFRPYNGIRNYRNYIYLNLSGRIK